MINIFGTLYLAMLFPALLPFREKEVTTLMFARLLYKYTCIVRRSILYILYVYIIFIISFFFQTRNEKENYILNGFYRKIDS